MCQPGCQPWPARSRVPPLPRRGQHPARAVPLAQWASTAAQPRQRWLGPAGWPLVRAPPGRFALAWKQAALAWEQTALAQKQTVRALKQTVLALKQTVLALKQAATAARPTPQRLGGRPPRPVAGVAAAAGPAQARAQRPPPFARGHGRGRLVQGFRTTGRQPATGVSGSRPGSRGRRPAPTASGVAMPPGAGHAPAAPMKQLRLATAVRRNRSTSHAAAPCAG